MQKIEVRHLNTTSNSQQLLEGFKIRSIKDLLAGKDMVQKLHRHDFFLVLAVKKGKGDHIIDFVRYKIRDNAVFFLRPGQVHELHLQKGSTGYLVEFNGSFWSSRENFSNQAMRKVSSKNYCELKPEAFNKLFLTLTTAFHEYEDKQPGFKDIILASLEIFFIELMRQSRNPQKTSKITSSYTQERLEDLLSFLEKYIFTHKRVSEYADMLHLTTYQLNAITKTMLGKTCSDLINDQLILESKRMLLATSNQVNQIASQLGYDDVSYFIRFFKKHTGLPPEAFRNKFG